MTDAAETHCKHGPAGESTGPATSLSSPVDTQPGDRIEAGSNPRWSQSIPLHEVQAADSVEVWSHTAQLWFPAVVDRVLDDSSVEVSFYVHQIGARVKDLPRSSPELRPFRPMRDKG